MAMDLLRSCRNGFMRFDPARPDLLTPVEWYFCQPGAKIFPGYHRFATTNYQAELTQADQTLGMIPDLPQNWVDGNPPSVATGQHYCGPRSRFITGMDLVSGPAQVIDVNGIPACCYPGGLIPPNLIWHGGILMEDDGYVLNQSSDPIPLEF